MSENIDKKVLELLNQNLNDYEVAERFYGDRKYHDRVYRIRRRLEKDGIFKRCTNQPLERLKRKPTIEILSPDRDASEALIGIAQRLQRSVEIEKENEKLRRRVAQLEEQIATIQRQRDKEAQERRRGKNLVDNGDVDPPLVRK